MVTSCVVVNARDWSDTSRDRAKGKDTVDKYLLAREDVEEELGEFYRLAKPREEPSQNSEAMEKLRYHRGLLYTAGLPAGDLAGLLEGGPGVESRNDRKVTVYRSVKKRTTVADEARRWTDGIVPYVFTTEIDSDSRIEYLRAMQSYERFSCIRFHPWETVDGVTTNQKFGLQHESYLNFVKGSGCYYHLGNIRKKGGAQSVSCCGIADVCVQELGHAFGQPHEQQSPNPDRFRMIRIDLKNIKPE